MKFKDNSNILMSETHLFQILISSEEESKTPSSLIQLSNTLLQSFPYAKYSLWNDSMITNFLEKEFEPDVLEAYKSLIPFAYRSDLARYCLLYKFGGWYIDLGIQMAFPGKEIAPLSYDMVFFWDAGDLLAPFRNFYDCMNGIIYSKPSNPVLKIAIDLVVKNCKSKYYGFDSMSPTGPGVFGRAIAINGKGESYYDGQFLQLTPQHAQANKAYVLKDGTIFAWHRSRFETDSNYMASLGLKGGNDYRLLWRDRKVYFD